MSCYHVYLKDRKKVCQPVNNREEFLALRNESAHLQRLSCVRNGDEKEKKRLLQFNYSCIPAWVKLRGCKNPSDLLFLSKDLFNNSPMKTSFFADFRTIPSFLAYDSQAYSLSKHLHASLCQKYR